MIPAELKLMRKRIVYFQETLHCTKLYDKVLISLNCNANLSGGKSDNDRAKNGILGSYLSLVIAGTLTLKLSH